MKIYSHPKKSFPFFKTEKNTTQIKIIIFILNLFLVSICCSKNRAGMALTLDGDGDYVFIGNLTQLQIMGDVTIEAWVYIRSYPTSTFPFAEIVQQTGQDNLEENNELYTLAINGDGEIDCFHENGEGVNNTLFSKSVVPTGQWIHLATVRDALAQTYQIFINGVLDTMSTYDHNATGGSNTALFIGSNYDGLDFDGMIDEVRIWNKVRSQRQIQSTMNRSLKSEYYVSSDSGLVGYWRFDLLENLGMGNDGLIDDMRDLSIYRNHGDLVKDAALVPSGAFVQTDMSE
ncbi:LamG domain-containing protein [bacterium]|nr:LamG domain-containing protein [bacterium]